MKNIFSKLSNWEIVSAGIVLLVGLVFAVVTDHQWEDWYITYRISKNLALGNGLVFTIGERLHTFTSPFNTLAPALISYLTGNVSDAIVIWGYRILCCFLFACSIILLTRFSKESGCDFPAKLTMMCLFAVDARIIDFTINGQETAFMVFFMYLSIYFMIVPSRRPALSLGLAWAGVMFTRPDGFIYFGSLSIGFLLFNPVTAVSTKRSDMIRLLCRAGVVALFAYLPWTIFTWVYYGTPIPHTIIAKGLNQSLDMTLSKLARFPLAIFSDVTSDFTSLTDVFMPSYFSDGGWSILLARTSKVLALVAAIYWCAPWGNRHGRAVSFAIFTVHVYLSCISAYIAPWYIPIVTALSIFVLGVVLQQLHQAVDHYALRAKIVLRGALIAFSGILITGSILMTVAVGYQLRIRQSIIEGGNRKSIGLWLKGNSSKGDTVFLECLGYIGYFSQLKMYDYPGLASTEVVATRKRLGTNDFSKLIQEMTPDWLVLRENELNAIRSDQVSGRVLSERYEVKRVFDVSEAVNSYSFLPGREYLLYDSRFTVYKRNDSN